MTEQSITKQIGKPSKINLLRPRAIGSPGYYLKSFHNKNKNIKSLEIDSKCNFERRTDGILLRANFSNKLTAIPIPKETIVEINLKRGKESITPLFLSPMWFLLKLGISILYARYFRLGTYEYSIDQMKLSLKTTEYEMDLIANGYLFERQLNFFENLNYGSKLKLKSQQY